MLMRELTIRNKDFISLLDELAKRTTNLIENRRDIVMASLAFEVQRQDPGLRRARGFSDPYIHAPDWDILPEDWRNIKEGQMDPCGIEYLNYQIDKLKTIGPDDEATKGWPNREVFTGIHSLEKHSAEYMKLPKEEHVHEIARKISYDFLGGNSIALTAIYPPGGYIPWHNNGNAPGHNLLLHYSLGGDGEFITYHEGELHSYKDKDREWVARAGAFISTHGEREDSNNGRPLDTGAVTLPDEADKASWHCARTNDWRFTLSTIIPQRDMWELVVEELEEE